MNPRGTAAVAALLDRYLLGLDDDKLDDDWARSLFTADATVEFPMSRHSGLAGMAGWHRDALAAFRIADACEVSRHENRVVTLAH